MERHSFILYAPFYSIDTCARFLQSQLIQVMWLVSSHNPARVRLLNLVIVMMTLLLTFFFFCLN